MYICYSAFINDNKSMKHLRIVCCVSRLSQHIKKMAFKR